MYKNIYEVREAYEKGEKLSFLFFWGHTTSLEEGVNLSCLSQWYPCDFTVDDVKYANAEQFMMAGKALLFHDMEIFKQIINIKDPKTIKSLGRKVKGFQEEIWKRNRLEIVKQGNIAKFTQNKELGNFLLSTNNTILVEASPYDKIWGIGMGKQNEYIENPTKWKGQNLLGFVLMEVRKELVDLL